MLKMQKFICKLVAKLFMDLSGGPQRCPHLHSLSLLRKECGNSAGGIHLAASGNPRLICLLFLVELL